VGDLGEFLATEVKWVFAWQHPLFVWENELLLELKEDLEGFRGRQEEDAWRWRLVVDGRFTVKSLYSKLEGLMIEEDSITLEQRKVFSRIWKSVAPSKVVAFSWKLLHNRIPTKVNLSHRHVLSPESSLNRVMCAGGLETANHLMLHCTYAMKVWDGVMRWLGFNVVIPPNLFSLWECWDGVSNNKKIRKGLRMIWHAVVWSLWRARNDRIFNNSFREMEELVEDIKVLSWRWCLNRMCSPACLFYEWHWEPKQCLLR